LRFRDSGVDGITGFHLGFKKAVELEDLPKFAHGP